MFLELFNLPLYAIPKSCLFCGSFAVSNFFYCKICHLKLKDKIKPCKRKISVQGGNQITIRSLFDWNPNESDLLSETLSGLKGHHQEKQWRLWAKEFILWHRLFSTDLETIFIPCWNKGKKSEHAEIFAMSLKKEMNNKPTVHLLCRKTTQPLCFRDEFFKKLSRDQRQKSTLRHEIFSKIDFSKSQQKLVFIDDIVTTGITAEIAYESLGKPSNFEVWCLAYRTNLSLKLAPAKGV